MNIKRIQNRIKKNYRKLCEMRGDDPDIQKVEFFEKFDNIDNEVFVTIMTNCDGEWVKSAGICFKEGSKTRDEIYQMISDMDLYNYTQEDVDAEEEYMDLLAAEYKR